MHFPFSDVPALGQTVEVAPGVLWLRMPLPYALDHINLWLIADGDGWVAVDTGFGLPPAQEAWQKLLAQRPLTRLIVTHFHPDHVGLAGWLMERTGAPLMMSALEFLSAQAVWLQAPGFSVQDMVRFFRTHGLDEAQQTALIERGNSYRRGVPMLPHTFHRLRDGDRIRIGAHDWQVIVGRGHAPEHVSLYCHTLGVLISGDMLLPKISTNVSVWAVCPEDDPLGDFLASLPALEALPANTLVLPSHGLPFRGIPQRIAALRAHHEARLAEILAACHTPRCAAELVPIIFPRPLDTHQLVFAFGETIAHLNHAWHAGQLMRQADSDGKIRFVHTNH